MSDLLQSPENVKMSNFDLDKNTIPSTKPAALSPEELEKVRAEARAYHKKRGRRQFIKNTLTTALGIPAALSIWQPEMMLSKLWEGVNKDKMVESVEKTKQWLRKIHNIDLDDTAPTEEELNMERKPGVTFGDLGICEATLTARVNASKVLLREIPKYPIGFLHKNGMNRFRILNQPTKIQDLTKGTVGGIFISTWPDTVRLYARNSQTQYGEMAGADDTTHHELFHLLDFNKLGYDWNTDVHQCKCDPYGTDSSVNDFPDHVTPDAFVNDYSKTSSSEDRAEIASALMRPDSDEYNKMMQKVAKIDLENAQTGATNNPLQNKIIEIKQAYYSLSEGLMNEQYWADLESGIVNQDYWMARQQIDQPPV